MIVRIPYRLPDPDSEEVYCLVFGESLQGTFARDLERSFDTVCLAPGGGDHEYFEHAVHELAAQASGVVAWLGGDRPESMRWVPELAGLIETRPEALVIGAKPGAPWCWAGCLSWRLGQRGFPTYDNIADLLTAARHRGRQQRTP